MRQRVSFPTAVCFRLVRRIERRNVVLPENVQALHLADGLIVPLDSQIPQKQPGNGRHCEHQRVQLVGVAAFALEAQQRC